MFAIEETRFLVFFLLLNIGITLWNTWGMPRLGRYDSPAQWPFVSILVPARNEADTIESCLLSPLHQDYPSFEVIVLDDQSTDGTSHILARLKHQHPQLRVLQGATLPPGWLGKHWACHQLAEQAKGELLLFTDADTYHQPDTLRRAVAALETMQADLISLLPHQEAHTWGERLIIPFIAFGIYAFLPMPLVGVAALDDDHWAVYALSSRDLSRHRRL